MFSAQFLSEIVGYALEIARQVRGEDHLQSCAILASKFQAECKELAEAEVIWDEIPDVVYYSLCLAAQGENYALARVEHEILPRYRVSVRQAEAATRAKYARRAAGEPKDIEQERAAILAAI